MASSTPFYTYDDAVTPERIAEAKAYNATQRQRVEDVTGIRMTDDGRFMHAYSIACPRCLTLVGGENEGTATRQLARHLVAAHVRQEQGR